MKELSSSNPSGFELVYWAISLILLTISVVVSSRSAIRAIKIGRQLNEEQQKDNAKRSLFFTLFSYRGSPLNQNFVDGLNRIDVIFHDDPKVLVAWHALYDSYEIKGQANAERAWELLRVELLSQMALVLGYGKLKQIDIQRFYYPEGHDNQYQSDLQFRKATLTFLQTGHTLYQAMLDNMSAQKGMPDQEMGPLSPEK